MKILRRIGLGFALFVLLLLAVLLVYRGSTLPKISGTLKLHGLSAAVQVVRDESDVPHLYAASTDDAYFALGFVHAQDRLWQMEVNRRIAAGRLAELLGPGALDTDRFLRTLGIYHNAEAIYENLDAPTRHALERYAAGVNAYLGQHNTLPPEFLVFREQVEPWKPADSIAWSTMMAWDLSGNWSMELMRMRLAQRLTLAQINEFLPPYPGDENVTAGHGDAPLATADYTALYRQLKPVTALLEQAHALAPAGFIDGMGSNNWVVSGAHTVSGKPLLANDPHLGLSAPSVWYFAHLVAPGLNVFGATLPGMPFVVLGRNDRIAWGFTNTGPDTQDLYIEEIRDGKVRTPTGWQALMQRTEIIKVKGQADVTLTVRESRHGPLITDVSKSAGEAAKTVGPQYGIAFQWAALRSDDKTMQAGLNMNRAHNWDEFVAALRDFDSPEQNIVYADVDNNIGLIAPGRVPLRKASNDLKGQAPAPGWDARYDWDGFIPFEQLPRRYNPPEGRIVTANQKIIDNNYPYFMTSEWTAPYRARRIAALLDKRQQHTLQSFANIQSDVYSLAAAEMLPLMLQHIPHPSEQGRAALDMLKDWNGLMADDKIQPSIYNAWVREFGRLVYADELGPELFDAYWDQRAVFLTNVLSNHNGQGHWCDDIRTPQHETCDDMVTRALDMALADLTKRAGSDMNGWKWGLLHYARLEHQPFTHVPLLVPLFDLTVATGGDTYTVNVGRNFINDEKAPFASRHAASLRAIYDLSSLTTSQFIDSTGQSGNRLSVDYTRFLEIWAAGKTHFVRMMRQNVEQGAQGTLTLEPDH